MEDMVPVDTEESIKEDIEVEEDEDLNEDAIIFVQRKHGIKSRYRLARKLLSSFFRKKAKKTCIDVLYITDGSFSNDYILELQKRYPDKIIKVLVPHFGNFSKLDKSITDFNYFLQNKQFSAKLYRYPITNDNIQVYGIYSKVFSDLIQKNDIYKFQNIIHYAACARLAEKHLRPDIVHSENIPFFLGLEFSKKNNSAKVFQTIHDFDTYQELEPFWAAINCLDKNGMNKLCNDKIIKKNVAALFGIKNINNFSKFKECLEYLYQNFERYRKAYKKDDNTNENILLERLDSRVLELFGYAFIENFFNPVYYSIKNSSFWAINSRAETDPEWAKRLSRYNYLQKGICNKNVPKIAHPFDISNFRYYREYNKQYITKEFAEKQIKSNFVDLNLFTNDEVKIYGYLDGFYKGTLLFATFNNLKDNEIKTITNAVLKCFELKKNIQVIFNMSADFNNDYLKSFIDFLEQQPSLEGRWLFVEGDINLPQFMAASDIVLLPTSNAIGVEDILYTAMKFGCIPVTTNQGICGEIVVDIFDDMKTGFGFKDSDNRINYSEDAFTNTLLKALNFYIQNFTSWKILIENAISYDSSWNNELLEEYNKIYDKIL